MTALPVLLLMLTWSLIAVYLLIRHYERKARIEEPDEIPDEINLIQELEADVQWVQNNLDSAPDEASRGRAETLIFNLKLAIFTLKQK